MTMSLQNHGPAVESRSLTVMVPSKYSWTILFKIEEMER